MRILVADDDAVTRLLLQAHLTKWGHDVVLCSDGAQAWELLREQNSPKLAILDWMMPQKDGLEICIDLRKYRTESYIYIILLTSKSSKEDLINGLDAGADDYIIKPFDNNELRTRVRAGARIVQLQDDLIKALKASEFQASHDALTGLLNRSAILKILENELIRSGREGTSLSVVMADIDHFKKINDQHGHLAGDAVLREAAQRLQNSIRPYDSCGRYGGEEFLIVIPGAQRNIAHGVAERLRQAFAGNPIQTPQGSFAVTVSLGAATVDKDQAVDMDSFIRNADEALYRAKELGRNRTEFAA